MQAYEVTRKYIFSEDSEYNNDDDYDNEDNDNKNVN